MCVYWWVPQSVEHLVTSCLYLGFQSCGQGGSRVTRGSVEGYGPRGSLLGLWSDLGVIESYFTDLSLETGVETPGAQQDRWNSSTLILEEGRGTLRV